MPELPAHLIIAAGETLDLPNVLMPDLSEVEPARVYVEPFASLLTLLRHGVVDADQASRHAVVALINAMQLPDNGRYDLGSIADACRTVLAACQGIDTDKD